MIQLHDKKFTPYILKDEIRQIVTDLAGQLNHDFKDKNPLFIGVLNGSFMFVSDLMKQIEIDVELSFIKLASYHGMSSTGQITELIGLSDSINHRNVVVIEDIVDTGNTLAYLIDVLKTHEIESLTIVTLLMKPDVFNKKFPVQYVGKNIPNKFVVGYGLDYNELGRNLNEIYQLAED